MSLESKLNRDDEDLIVPIGLLLDYGPYSEGRELLSSKLVMFPSVRRILEMFMLVPFYADSINPNCRKCHTLEIFKLSPINREYFLDSPRSDRRHLYWENQHDCGGGKVKVAMCSCSSSDGPNYCACCCCRCCTKRNPNIGQKKIYSHAVEVLGIMGYKFTFFSACYCDLPQRLSPCHCPCYLCDTKDGFLSHITRQMSPIRADDDLLLLEHGKEEDEEFFESLFECTTTSNGLKKQ